MDGHDPGAGEADRRAGARPRETETVSGYKDGFKRGTNYNRRVGARLDPAGALIAAAAAQSARCEDGEHDEAIAEKGRVTYLGYGQRIEPGTRYCRRCQEILPKGDGTA